MTGSVNINGSTLHVEGAIGLAGLRWARVLCRTVFSADENPHSGLSGYGRFDVDSFTNKRVITLHPAKSSYPLIGL
jgi:hypothetical protein